MPISEWLRKNKASQRQHKYVNKDLVLPHEVYLQYKFSQGAVDFVSENGKKLTAFRKQVQKIVQTLVGLQNKLFGIYKDMKDV
mmetsp:Transcript_13560/g.12038  ORF Transcript_13560/g.12038 Transcript_13560/m.12038 type:complete len:83 (+) Transcript_13560:463-711(+)